MLPEDGRADGGCVSANRIATEATLKSLQTRYASLKAEADALDATIRETERRHNDLSREMSQVQADIEAMQDETKEPIVSEHALLQYLARAKGVDMDALRSEILDGRRELIQKLGSGKWKTAEGLTIVVKNRTVVTVYGERG